MQMTLGTIPHLLPTLKPGERIYLKGDLGSGKTTFVKACIQKLQKDPSMLVQSPTYMYYKEYPGKIFHFDLYRIENYATFVDIGGEEIFDDPESIIFVEWPELIEHIYAPTQTIIFTKTEDETVRDIQFIPPRLDS